MLPIIIEHVETPLKCRRRRDHPLQSPRFRGWNVVARYYRTLWAPAPRTSAISRVISAEIAPPCVECVRASFDQSNKMAMEKHRGGNGVIIEPIASNKSSE